MPFRKLFVFAAVVFVAIICLAILVLLNSFSTDEHVDYSSAKQSEYETKYINAQCFAKVDGHYVPCAEVKSRGK